MNLHRIPALAAGLLLTTTAGAQDAERAAHGDAAATPQVSYEKAVGGVTVRQYQLGCLSQLTYLIVSDGHALVVDPERDIDHYLRDARTLGARIEYVALTHTNADFVAGHTELARREKAEVLISAESGSLFAHRGMHDGDAVQLGRARIEFVATPGHTLDSMSLLVHAPAGSEAVADPVWVLTGDALFIGSIGRPDLAQGTISPLALANRAFDSIQRFRTMPDATIVLPAHGAGSLCGAHLSPDTSSTIGREKAENPFFQASSRAAFVSKDVSGLPPAPPYFACNVALNRQGPPVVDWTDELPPVLSPAAARDTLGRGAWIVDVRDARAYAAGHVAGSVNISVRGRLDTWTGMVVPFEAPIVLVGSEGQVREAAFRFKRIGLDHVVGRLGSDMDAARNGGLDVRRTKLVAPAELASRIAQGTEPILVDVRTREEYDELAIGEYANLPLTDWKQFGKVLDQAVPILFVCNSAYRSSMAVGLAERLGFEDVGSLEGGLDAWLDANLPVRGTAKICGSNAGAAASDTIDLPEPIEPQQLAALLRDQPQNYVVVDVRPAWQHAEYHVGGAVSVEPGAVAAYLATLPKNARVVLVDRDGTVAWWIAGAAAHAQAAIARPLRVLVGGTQRYWREIEVRGGAPSPSAQPAPARAPQPEPVPVKPAAKKRSAGC